MNDMNELNEPFPMDQDIKGLTITRAEPVNWPLTDGVIIYLTDGNGKQYALEIGADPVLSPEGDENPFYWSFGEAPEDQEDA